MHDHRGLCALQIGKLDELKDDLKDVLNDHHALGVLDAHSAPTISQPDDHSHVLDDHYVVGAQNCEQDVRYYEILLLALAYLSLQNHCVHRCCRYYLCKVRVRALDNQADLGYVQADLLCRRDLRGYGFLAYVNSRASLVLPRSEYPMELEHQ